MPTTSGIAGLQTGSASSTAASAAKSQLGKDDFLKLMMSQLRNQNPMEPLKDTEFIAQLAQFSQLEGIDKLNTNMSSLLLMQGLSQATNLIGKSVVYDKDTSGGTARGTVDSVAVSGGQVQLVIGGTPVNMSQVRTVQAGTARAA
jgi:flagellar basal-body rod modification protein FlgD